MARRQSELIDAIDLLSEAQGLLEAAYLAAEALQLTHEKRAMQAVIGKSADTLTSAIEHLEAAHKTGDGP